MDYHQIAVLLQPVSEQALAQQLLQACTCEILSRLSTGVGASLTRRRPCHRPSPAPPCCLAAGAHHFPGQEPQLHFLWNQPVGREGPLLGGAEGNGQGHQQDSDVRWVGAQGRGFLVGWVAGLGVALQYAKVAGQACSVLLLLLLPLPLHHTTASPHRPPPCLPASLPSPPSCTPILHPAAEIIKRRIVGLHQDTAISSVELRDHWEPKEEGLDPIETTRHVSVITITLSKVGTCGVGWGGGWRVEVGGPATCGWPRGVGCE